MNEFDKIMRSASATPEILEASKKQLQMILGDLSKTDPSFVRELPDKMFHDLHTYFFRHQFSTLKEEMPEKIKNWVLFHQNEYQKPQGEKDEKK